MRDAQYVEFSGIKLINSPYYHIFAKDIDSFWFHDFEIEVDIMGQLNLDKLLGNNFGLDIKIPTFPLNTDGIDPAGSNILIERVNITNYDDAVAIKPCSKSFIKSTCSENIIVRDCITYASLGMSIGSVPPSPHYNCIRNTTFKDIVMYHPIKGIYVKTNTGGSKTDDYGPGEGGEITNIVYDNIDIHFPIWWGIYIGPQQQKQPDGSGDGCMFYPFGGC